MKIIITGATGMVGEGVLHVCLQHSDVSNVLVIGRRSCNVLHSKLREVLAPDLLDLSAIAGQLSGYDACFHCLGISSLGIAADDYYRTTYTLTLYLAKILSELNGDMTFCYVSGAGTDSTEKGRVSWAKVKGKTENDLKKLPFKQVFALRPGFIKPIKGLSNTHSFYKYINWLFPIGRVVYPSGFCTMEELAVSMINVTKNGYAKFVLEGKDIIKLYRAKTNSNI